MKSDLVTYFAEQIKLTKFYVRKLFCIKNIALFIIVFFSVWTLFYSFNLITTYINLNEGEPSNLLKDRWNIKLYFISFYLSFMVSYSYIYLKKNNLDGVNDFKNSVSNFTIIITLFLLPYLIMLIIIIQDYQNVEVASHTKVYFFNTLYLFFVLFISTFLCLVFLSNLNVKDKHSYFFVTFFFIIFLILAINILVKTFSTFNAQLNTYYKHLIFIESTIFLVLLIPSFVKRVLVYRKSQGVIKV